MIRRGKIGWASLFSLCGCLAGAAVYTLNRGVLMGSTVLWQSTRDVQAGMIHNSPLRKCRYLRLSGFAERAAEEQPCRFFASD
jgi:hypothetical protein